MKTECDYFNGWIKKKVTHAKISPKMVNPRYIAGNVEGEEEMFILITLAAVSMLNEC